MKKTLLCMALVSVSFYGYASYAAEVSPTEELVSDIVSNMQNISPVEQLKRLETYENIISEITIDEDSKQVLVSYIQSKKDEANKKIEQSKQNEAKDIAKTIEIHNSKSNNISNINREEISNFWIGLHNTERENKGLSLFSYNAKLETTANIRAETIKNSGKSKNFHQRKTSDGYYNYNSIKAWFENLGVEPEDGLFSENIGWGYYRCGNGDCTESIKKAIQSTRDFFMKEKAKNGPHYKAIANGSFTQIGLGISLDPASKKYYLVTHYIK